LFLNPKTLKPENPKPGPAHLQYAVLNPKTLQFENPKLEPAHLQYIVPKS
jgi:hypothetical protein